MAALIVGAESDPTTNAQAAFINPLVYGNVAFIRRGGCNLVTKVTNALSKGARDLAVGHC